MAHPSRSPCCFVLREIAAMETPLDVLEAFARANIREWFLVFAGDGPLRSRSKRGRRIRRYGTIRMFGFHQSIATPSCLSRLRICWSCRRSMTHSDCCERSDALRVSCGRDGIWWEQNTTLVRVGREWIMYFQWEMWMLSLRFERLFFRIRRSEHGWGCRTQEDGNMVAARIC